MTFKENLSPVINPLILGIANLFISTSLILQNVKTSKDIGGKVDGPLLISAILYFLSFLLRIIMTYQNNNDGINCGIFQMSSLVNIMAYTLVIGFKISNLNKSSVDLKKFETEKEIEPEKYDETENISDISVGSASMMIIAYFLYILFCSFQIYIFHSNKSDRNIPINTINYTLTLFILIICLFVFPLLIVQRAKKNKIFTAKSSIGIDTINIVMFILLIILLSRIQNTITSCENGLGMKFK